MPKTSTDADTTADGRRDRTRAAQRDAIAAAALLLLDRDGPAAVTTRAVSAAAGVQPMTIYRLFGDMDQVLEAATSRGFDEYLEAKRGRRRADDPVDDLRAGWDMHVEYALTHPHGYAQTYGRYVPGPPSPAVRAASEMLRELVERVAQAGRLGRSVDSAAQMIHASGCGVALTLMQLPPAERDMSISVDVREAVLASVTDVEKAAPSDGLRSFAVALDTSLGDQDDRFSPAELALLHEWLGRLNQPRPRISTAVSQGS